MTAVSLRLGQMLISGCQLCLISNELLNAFKNVIVTVMCKPAVKPVKIISCCKPTHHVPVKLSCRVALSLQKNVKL